VNSRVMTGKVFHKRSHPAEHTLRYSYLFFSLDLDELELLSKKSILFSYNSFGIFSIHDRDYLDRDIKGTIKEKVLKKISGKGVKGVKKIILITAAKYLGYAFNPVSFYYCYDRGDNLKCIVAEVNNTFRERHIYYLTDPVESEEGYDFTFRAEKKFHVSPFNNMEGKYEMFFSKPGDRVRLGIKLLRDNREIIDARLSGKGRAVNRLNLMKAMAGYPFTVLLTVYRIHKEAFKLFFMKKLKYHPKPEPISPDTAQLRKLLIRERIAMKIFKKVFSKLENGSLSVFLPDGKSIDFGSKKSEPRATMKVNNWKAFCKFVYHGETGMGEGFVDRQWDSDNLIALIDLYLANLDVLNANDGIIWKISNFLRKISFRKLRNTHKRAEKNIGAHYDLGNHLFGTFLDKSMMYSSGIFLKKTDTLNQSQKNKIHKLIEKTGITSKDHVLEIGSGWGGFAIEAVKKTGCRVTTITISREQYEYVTDKIKEEDLSDKITILMKDYRHMEGTFDKIISIEMLEAVGKEFIPDYFKQCERLLAPGGSIGLQVITTPDNRQKEYEENVDWIQTYIFPGGYLPSINLICRNLVKHTNLHVHHLENIGYHYVRTLELWRKNFIKSSKKLLDMGYDSRFQRMWLYYLYICEAGFKSRVINNLQIVLTRDMNSGVPDPYSYRI